MSTVYIIDLEAVPTRYTVQWKAGLPASLNEFAIKSGSGYDVVNISGGDVEMIATPGAFLNFAGTNVYKSNQAIEISKLFSDGLVKDGDRFLFTDAWNPVIIMVKYMVELLNIKAELHGIWHAGSYDPQDFLGRLVKDKRWSLGTEGAIFHALDFSYFATKYHIELFKMNVLNSGSTTYSTREELETKMVLSGQPHESLLDALKPFRGAPKRDLILFPHRVAPEKQPEIFRDLAISMPEYEFVVCQDEQLSKDAYHQLLAESKIVFSANLQETLGISAMEGVALNAIPFVPGRLSYTEMYDEWCYDSKMTESWDAYLAHKPKIIEMIRNYMKSHDKLVPMIERQMGILNDRYLSGRVMYRNLTR